MIRTVYIPHLPQSKVKHLIIGEKYEKMLKNAANEYDFELICLRNNPYVDDRLCGHADLMAVHLGSNKLAMCSFLEGSEAHIKLQKLGVNTYFTRNSILSEYPHDASLNFCIVGDALLYNSKTVENEIVNKLTIANKINCKQGYTKCSCCVVDEHSIITEDSGIASAALKAGLDVLHIENSGVTLSGFAKGFIGGASFKLAPDVMAFTGNIINNNVRDRIEDFLNNRDIRAVYLNACPAFDIGSAIPITETL